MYAPQPGDRVGNYLLDEQVGTGTFGQVFKARHHVFNDVVAVKIPTDPLYVRYLRREGLAIHGLRHPNIVRAIDLDPYGQPPYLVVEYVDGPTVRQLINQHAGGLSIASAAAVLDGTLSALVAAHEAGLVHRDVKPENILVLGRDEFDALTPDRVKVTDFGLRAVEDTDRKSMIQSGSLVGEEGRRLAGTAVYMSPEQRSGGELDGRSDLYALGVVLHEMLTGQLPHGTDLPGSIRSDTPAWMDELFERTYTRLDHRFASARDMQEVLRRHHRAGPAATGAGSRPPPLPTPGGDRRACPACHELVPDTDQFCIFCGRQLVPVVRRCPMCHAYLGPTDRFCVLCGEALPENDASHLVRGRAREEPA